MLNKKKKPSLTLASSDKDKVWHHYQTDEKARKSLSQSSSFDSHDIGGADSGPSLSSSSSTGSINTCLRAEGVNTTEPTSDIRSNQITTERNRRSFYSGKETALH